ncbi:hypothetical protein NM688_g692 [Phlebia brevispora]|uniref:Uncharacterized protein n=1 Tax=Phlebia brevispora TaxID=194682 RepID=A0ACC1TE06_9APHY|nr:hypothetical protein NM688_g692 [Phlebia brevispora]
MSANQSGQRHRLTIAIWSNHLNSNKPTTKRERRVTLDKARIFAETKLEELVALDVSAQKAHQSAALDGISHITLEGWNRRNALVAYCHVDSADPTRGEVLIPDRTSMEKFAARAALNLNTWEESDAIVLE